MAKDDIVKARVDKELKEQADAIFAQMGLTMSGAILLMLRQTVIQNKLPFAIDGAPTPNARVRASMEARDREGSAGVTTHGSSKEFFEALGIGKG